MCELLEWLGILVTKESPFFGSVSQELSGEV